MLAMSASQVTLLLLCESVFAGKYPEGRIQIPTHDGRLHDYQTCLSVIALQPFAVTDWRRHSGAARWPALAGALSVEAEDLQDQVRRFLADVPAA